MKTLARMGFLAAFLVAKGTAWALEPRDPQSMPLSSGPSAEPGTASNVPPADVEPKPGIPGGRYEEMTIDSRATGGPRRALVWVPPGLAASGEPAPALYLLGGLACREFGKVHTVAENLLAEGRLPPFFLILVPPVDRNAEYEDDVCTTTALESRVGGPGSRAKPRPPGRHGAFERFLVTELVPAVEARWPVRKDPAGRGVMGASLGGFTALSVVARNPGVFGRCGAQSTSNGVDADFEALLSDLARLPAGAARFHVDVGAFASNPRGADLLAASRRLRSVLARRQAIQYREVPEGHCWGSWRARLAEALTYFWGDARTPGKDAQGAARPLEAPPEGAARFTGAPVSLDVKDADLGEVIRSLTSGRGLSVVAPSDLRGTVTATLREVPWDQALDLVLAGNGWGFVREGTVIRIVRRDDPAR